MRYAQVLLILSASMIRSTQKLLEVFLLITGAQASGGDRREEQEEEGGEVWRRRRSTQNQDVSIASEGQSGTIGERETGETQNGDCSSIIPVVKWFIFSFQY